MENETTANTTDAFHHNKERLGKDINGMVTEASELLKTYGGKKLESAKQTFTQAQTVVGDTYKQYADVTDEYVHANPWKALGIAAAAGVLVGILMSRR
jgi:ElaB/YqjD/DUF883 family membrane-anchored ribosome-binding protein